MTRLKRYFIAVALLMATGIVLHNVAAVPSSFDAVCAAVEGAGVAVDVLQMFRDVPDIAASTLRLLLLLTNSDAFVQGMLTNPTGPAAATGRFNAGAGAGSGEGGDSSDVMRRLKAICKIVDRKLAMAPSTSPRARSHRVVAGGGSAGRRVASASHTKHRVAKGKGRMLKRRPAAGDKWRLTSSLLHRLLARLVAAQSDRS